MPKYVALLRAINVGGHTVKMDDLRKLFSKLGFRNVETFIASGNVIFDSPAKSSRALEQRIEAALATALGYEVATFVRSTKELAEIAQYKPFPERDLSAKSNTIYVGFMAAEPNAAVRKKLQELATPVDEFHLHGREVYWLCRTSFSKSQISGALLTKALGVLTTLRNSTTVKKMAAKYSG